MKGEVEDDPEDDPEGSPSMADRYCWRLDRCPAQYREVAVRPRGAAAQPELDLFETGLIRDTP